MAASAFPTHSPSASTIRKSFFDASAIGTISGNAIVAVYPITERKGKARNCFVSVHMTLFEVHKTQKDAKNKKAAKYLVDFADVFNVSLQNEPVQIKEDCICVMDPSTSYFIRPIDSDYDLQAWFDWILERSRECRCTKLLRPKSRIWQRRSPKCWAITDFAFAPAHSCFSTSDAVQVPPLTDHLKNALSLIFR